MPALDLTDPVTSANASVVSSNIKNFGHAPDLILNTLMTDMVESQRSMRQFNLATLARATRLVFDDTASDASDAAIIGQTAKIMQTTPPETAVNQALAQIASTQALILQLLSSPSVAAK